MKNLDPLEKFGRFLVENMRDNGIEFTEKLLKGEWKALGLQVMQIELCKLSDTQKTIMQDALIQTIDVAIHDFLFALQEQDEIQILSDGENVAKISDGIHGESFSDDGWNAKYSKFKSN